jgi:putative restriction endonuclease
MTGPQAARYGAGTTIRPRLGQGTFRYAVEAAYGSACAVTGEHSRPALEAAHIEPYTEGGPHEIPNGLLLRADLHRLFDAGYVSVTPDLEFRVSERLKTEFSNGRSYYGFDGRTIVTPTDARFAPDRDRLARHFEERFLR